MNRYPASVAGRWPLVGRAEELGLIAAALGDSATRCVLLSGKAGVGKTRLAREAVARAARDRWNVRWAIATEQTRSVPLGAVTPLLPDRTPEQDDDRFRLLGWARRCLSAGRSTRELIAIDDAPLLDDLTAGLVQQLVRSDAPLTLLLTARAEVMPEWLAALARDDYVEHVWVQELAETDVIALTESVLGGAVDAATRALLWTHSSGNPLWLRQLVGQGADDGALHCRDHVWRWDGPIGGRGLQQLLATRLERLPDAQRAALELVSVGEPLPAEVVRTLDISAPLDELAQRSLIELDATGQLRVAHPLYGSVTRAGLSRFARGAVEQRLADAFVACGPLPDSDVLRVACWRLDSGDTADAALMLDGAQRALLLDAALAERFARAACAEDSRYESLHVLGRALFDQRRGAEADSVYQQLLQGPLTIDERVGVTLETAMGRAWNEHDAPGAISMLRAAAADAGFAPYASRIVSMLAAVELFRGAPRAALDAGLPIASDLDEDVRTRVLAALAVVPALTLTGCVPAALELAEWAREVAPRQEFSGPISYGPTYADAQLEWEYAFALRWAGRVDDAITASTGSLRRAALEVMEHTQSYGLLNAAVGGAWLAAGNVRNALGPLRGAASALRESDVNGTVVSCLADLARAEALAGNVRAADELLAEAAERMTPATRAFAASLARARAVVAAMAGDLSRARREALAGADRAAESEQLVLEAACLHLLTRFDDAFAVHQRLAGIAEATDSGLVSIFAAHADALVRQSPTALEQVAGRFADAGSRMLAAHAAASAARAHRRAGRSAAANRMARRARDYSARCPDAPAPLLLVEPVPLTARERSVVELAGRGMSSQQIADVLVVSVRTVESHLQHIYRKLGVRSRAELGEASAESLS